MLCSKCGHELKNGTEFCSNCGEKQDNSLKDERNELPQSQQKNLRLPIILLSAGVGLALLTFFSWNGFGWIVSFLFTVLGFKLFLLDLKKRDNKKGIKSQIIAAVSSITVIPIVLISSAVINGAKQSTSSKSYYTYYNSPSYIQNAFESCHSTAEHTQALYSYDLNNDNTISGYEMELFFKAHPRAANDKLFMKWLESLSE